MPPATQRTGSNVAEFSVSEISGAVKRTVENAFGHVRVRGEVSGYRGPHSSGHAYFALADDRSRIESVIWKGTFRGLKFKPEEGMEVIATGRVTTYDRSSKYQLVIESLEPAGAGALMALLEERKRKLAAEGLFEDARKRRLPFMPRTIGIVTSPTGAVIRDIVHRVTDRFPVHLVVWPVRVQGETCGAEVAAGIAGLNRPGETFPRPDLIIVARGGGSLEDLWGFNDEAVVRAAAASEIPLISAVGHETDWTLIDLVADRRAPTPTGAAEMAVPVRAELIATVSSLAARQAGAASRLIARKRDRVDALARALPSADGVLALPRRRFDEAVGRLERGLDRARERAHARLAAVAPRLSPLIVRRALRDKRRTLDALSARVSPIALVRRVRDRSDDVILLGRQLRRAVRDTLANGGQAVRLAERGLELREQRIEQRLAGARMRFERLREGHTEIFVRETAERRARIDGLDRVLQSLGYKSVLARGYAVVRDANGRAVTDAAAIGFGDALAIELRDGEVRARAGEHVEGGEAMPRKATRRPAAKRPRPVPDEQGTLL